jgi:hypothetical protein
LPTKQILRLQKVQKHQEAFGGRWGRCDLSDLHLPDEHMDHTERMTISSTVKNDETHKGDQPLLVMVLNLLLLLSTPFQMGKQGLLLLQIPIVHREMNHHMKDEKEQATIPKQEHQKKKLVDDQLLLNHKKVMIMIIIVKMILLLITQKMHLYRKQLYFPRPFPDQKQERYSPKHNKKSSQKQTKIRLQNLVPEKLR